MKILKAEKPTEVLFVEHQNSKMTNVYTKTMRPIWCFHSYFRAFATTYTMSQGVEKCKKERAMNVFDEFHMRGWNCALKTQ
jgi:hypothetical protein